MTTRTFLLVALAALSCGIVRADDTPKLFGSTVKTEDAVSKSDAVFVGQITELGYPDPGATDMVSFDSKVKVSQILRGNVGAQISVLINIYGPNHEAEPVSQSSYIFFIKKIPDYNMVLKLLPATDGNIATVKKLISN